MSLKKQVIEELRSEMKQNDQRQNKNTKSIDKP